MCSQPVDLFADIRTSDQQCHFLRNSFFRHTGNEVYEAGERYPQSFANGVRLGRCACRRGVDQSAQLRKLVAQDRGKSGTLLGSGLDQPIERPPPTVENRMSAFLEE